MTTELGVLLISCWALGLLLPQASFFSVWRGDSAVTTNFVALLENWEFLPTSRWNSASSHLAGTEQLATAAPARRSSSSTGDGRQRSKFWPHTRSDGMLFLFLLSVLHPIDTALCLSETPPSWVSWAYSLLHEAFQPPPGNTVDHMPSYRQDKTATSLYWHLLVH